MRSCTQSTRVDARWPNAFTVATGEAMLTGSMTMDRTCQTTMMKMRHGCVDKPGALRDRTGHSLGHRSKDPASFA